MMSLAKKAFSFIVAAACLATMATSAHAQSSSYTLGSVVPGNLSFTDQLGKSHTFEELRGKPVVLEWTNYGCPFVRKHYDSNNMQTLQKTYTGKGVAWYSVISSAQGKQGYLSQAEAPAAVAKMGFNGTGVALDPQGTLGRAFGAETTPHMVILDATGKVVYHGAIDSIPSFSKEDISKATNYVAQSLDAILAGKAVPTPQSKAYGCGVKY